MTLSAILEEASERKGMEMIGIIDSHSPEVQAELDELMERGIASSHERGGIIYKKTMLVLGCEVEIKEENRGEAHFLCYVPDVPAIKRFTKWLSERCKNIHLSTQRVKASIRELQSVVENLGGICIPAHIFTPHKGLYGSCTDHLSEVADPQLIYGVELGLSANTAMADQISELHEMTFLTNSDAHSVKKIGREYQAVLLQEACFDEWVKAVKRIEQRRVLVNYGLHPELGKYHQTGCQACGSRLDDHEQDRCPACGFKRVVRGVDDRIRQLADEPAGTHPAHRPPYVEQIPLEYIPGLGPKSLDKLIQAFGTEMDIVHRVEEGQIAQVVGEKIARLIALARENKLELQKGSAGIYGKVISGR